MRKIKYVITILLFSLLLSTLGYASALEEYLVSNSTGWIHDPSTDCYLYRDNSETKSVIWYPYQVGGQILCGCVVKDESLSSLGYGNIYFWYNSAYKNLANKTSNVIDGSYVNDEGYWVCDHGEVYYKDSSGTWLTDDGCTYGNGNTNNTNANNFNGGSYGSNPIYNPYERNLSTSELDEVGQLDGAKIAITTPFHILEQQLGGEGYDISNNFDLFGIYLSGNIDQYLGNTAYLEGSGDNNNITKFVDLLTDTKYNFKIFSEFIEKIKEIFKITGTKLKKADSFISNKAANDAMKARSSYVKENIILDILEAICKTIGILLILYSIVIIIGGAIDETGIIEKSMMGILTNNGISKEKPLNMMNRNDHIQNAFRMSYLWVGGWCLLVGIFMWSSTLRGATMNLLNSYILNPLANFIGKTPTIKTWK